MSKNNALTPVWKKSQTGTSTLDMASFMGRIAFWTILGLATTAGFATMTMAWHPSIWTFLLVGLGLPITGILLASSFPILGYLLVTLGIGLTLGPAVGSVGSPIIIRAVWATLGVTLVTSAIGIRSPNSLAHWGTYLFGALIALLLVRVLQVITISMGIDTGTGLAFIDYLAAVLFSLFIIYDWNRARELDCTETNAIQAAMSIYLDIINLFTNLLSIFKTDD